MKYVKILGLLAVVASSFMALAASASATTVTGPGGSTTPVIHAVSEEKAVPGTKHVLLHNPIVSIECESTVEGDVEKHGSGVTAFGEIDILKFEPCTGNWVIDVGKKGSLEIHWTSGVNGTLTSSGAEVTATRFGISCVYETNGTHIGTVTGGTPATLHIEAKIPINTAKSSFLCGTSAANWTGAYVTTNTVNVDQ